MSDGRIRDDFAQRLSVKESNVFLRVSCRMVLSEERSCSGSRLNTKKVIRDNHLSYALLRSAFGRSED